MIPSMFNTFALVNVQDGNARKTFMMPAASIYGGPCLLIALALTTLEGPSEMAVAILPAPAKQSGDYLAGAGKISKKIVNGYFAGTDYYRKYKVQDIKIIMEEHLLQIYNGK